MTRDIAKDKRMRLYMRLLFVLFAFVGPILVVATKYNLFKEYDGWTMTVIGAIIVIGTIYRLRKRIMKWINEWEYSTFKYVLLGFSRIAIFIVIVVIAHLAQRESTKIVYVLDWYLVFNAVAYLVIVPIEEHYDLHIKRELRKTEMREVLHE